MNRNDSRKESLEKWLDSKVEAYKELWSEKDFVQEEKHTDIYTYDVENVIPLHGVVSIAEILGCCVKFRPSYLRTHTEAVVTYKGVELIENLY